MVIVSPSTTSTTLPLIEKYTSLRTPASGHGSAPCPAGGDTSAFEGGDGLAAGLWAVARRHKAMNTEGTFTPLIIAHIFSSPRRKEKIPSPSLYRRMGIAPVARPAGDCIPALEVILINPANHPKHLTRSLLGRLLLAVPLAFDVTVGAVYPEQGRERGHHL